MDTGSGGNFIVLRSLRLLRIFKLVRPMRHQMVVMIRTMSSVMTFFTLLFLFMFTFAILGMNIFGGKFENTATHQEHAGDTPLPQHSRSNFDTFVWSMVTVFQVSLLFNSSKSGLLNIKGIIASCEWCKIARVDDEPATPKSLDHLLLLGFYRNCDFV